MVTKLQNAGKRSDRVRPARKKQSMPSNVSSELARCFAREKNLVWPWLLDLYRDYCSSMKGGTLRRGGCVWPRSYFSINRCSPEKLCSRTFSSRASRCRWRDGCRGTETEAAVAKSERLQAPALAYQAHFLRGQLAHGRGDRPASLAAFGEGVECWNSAQPLALRGAENFFRENRLQVTKPWWNLHLSGGTGGSAAAEAFACIEAANLAA